MSKRWSKTEIAHLKRHADSQTLEELAQRFHTETAEVRAKMEELGLAGTSGDDHDAALSAFESALKLVQDGKWKKAAETFENVIAESDTHELTDRARQYLAICQHRLDGEPEIEDPYLAAVVSKNSGDVETAQQLISKAGSDDERIAYLQASLHALAGDDDQAIEALGKAIRLNPRNRVQAFHDPDFKDLRENEEFQGLLEQAQA
ncbi:MAG: tetratricopeptide repeat protein [Thermoanaerobaculia bacterium]|nr:tetratricopeptide repeat protein [Thermoanaerobaculia bacterium]